MNLPPILILSEIHLVLLLSEVFITWYGIKHGWGFEANRLFKFIKDWPCLAILFGSIANFSLLFMYPYGNVFCLIIMAILVGATGRMVEVNMFNLYYSRKRVMSKRVKPIIRRVKKW